MNSSRLSFIAGNAAHFLKNELHIECSVASVEVLLPQHIKLAFLTVSVDIEDDLGSTVAVGFGKELIEVVCREYTKGLCVASVEDIEMLKECAADVANIVVGNSMSIFQNDSKRAVHIGLPTIIRNDIWLCGDDMAECCAINTNFGSMEIYLIHKDDTGDD